MISGYFFTMAARLLAARTHGSRRAGSELGTLPYVCGLDGSYHSVFSSDTMNISNYSISYFFVTCFGRKVFIGRKYQWKIIKITLYIYIYIYIMFCLSLWLHRNSVKGKGKGRLWVLQHCCLVAYCTLTRKSSFIHLQRRCTHQAAWETSASEGRNNTWNLASNP